MGLNFHVVCHHHRVTGMILRGQESEALHHFYNEHSACRRRDKHAVETQGDEESEQWWMVSPPPTGYQEIDLFGTFPSESAWYWKLDLGFKAIAILVLVACFVYWLVTNHFPF